MNTESRSSSALTSPESRHRAREAAVQMLYQWEVGRVSMHDVLQTFWSHPPEGTPLTEDLRAFASSLASGTAEHVAAIDPLIVDAADNWRIERMNVLDRLILRLAGLLFLSGGERTGQEARHEPRQPGTIDHCSHGRMSFHGCTTVCCSDRMPHGNG